MAVVGKNVKADIKGNILTIVVELDESQGLSASGKSNIIATTSGNVELPGTDGAVLGFNLYRKV